jgi:hypothetical protein
MLNISDTLGPWVLDFEHLWLYWGTPAQPADLVREATEGHFWQAPRNGYGSSRLFWRG